MIQTTSKRLPVGIDNFEKLRQWDCYYVDKTAMIGKLVRNCGDVTLFTRPRRFGKSLNMSMLQYFFEIGTDKSIFNGLKITEDKAVCDEYMGKFPVVSITLKNVDGYDFETAYERLRRIIRNEALRLLFIKTSEAIPDEERSSYMRIIKEQDTKEDIISSLQMLCRLLEKHYGKKAILLIDEYDVPLDKAYAHGYYPQMIDVIRGMFSAALKSNNSLNFAVLTGCLRVSKESIFTGLNNLMVHSISDVGYDEYFGFTDDEVRAMLSYYGKEDHYDETREWYDGYRFGGQYVYCPWDVINYCDQLLNSSRPRPKAYWINSSGNDMVRELIDEASEGTEQADIERLIDGETITKTINEQLTHSEIKDNINNIWSLLYMTGYLTITDYPEEDLYSLKIPNREVREIYKRQVLEWFNDKARTEAKTDKLKDLYDAFETGDTQSIEQLLNSQLYDTVSFYDAYESFYHGFLLALLSTCAQWNVVSNREAGKGRSDIIVWRKDRRMGFVVEVKEVKEAKDLEAACREAMKQIESKDYPAGLRRYDLNEIIAYGIAFCEKKCRVEAKKIQSTAM